MKTSAVITHDDILQTEHSRPVGKPLPTNTASGVDKAEHLVDIEEVFSLLS